MIDTDKIDETGYRFSTISERHFVKKRIMDNSSDSTRAFVLVLILLMMIQGSSQSDKVECKTPPSPPNCASKCNDKWFYQENNGSCQECPKCGPGQRLDSDCGGKNGQNAKCVTCTPGMTFTDSDGYWCYLCRLCDNTVGDTPCNITTDAVCGKCRTGYYHEKDKPDQCHPCRFLLQPELEPHCQIPQELTTSSDPPQEGRQESTTTDALLASADLLPEEGAGAGPGSVDLDEEEQVVDAVVPLSHHNVSRAILGICVIALIIFVITMMYMCWQQQKPHGAIRQHRSHTDQQCPSNADEDSEGFVTVDGNAQTVCYYANGRAKAGELARTENQPCGQLSCSSGVLSHIRSADSVSRSSSNLLGSTSNFDPHLSHGHLPSDAIMPVDDERDEMITTPINTAADSSTSCSYYNSDAVHATPSEVLPERRRGFQLSGEPLVFPTKHKSSQGENVISPGSLPGKASNVGTRHPTTEGPKMGVDSPPSMVTSAVPLATLRIENEIDTDAAVSCASVVVDVAAAPIYSPSTSADTHADAAMDDSSAASVNAVTSGAVAVTAIFPDETDGAEIEETPNTAYGLITKDTGACRERKCSSPLLKATTQKKVCKKSKVRVAPSNPGSSNGNKKSSSRRNYIKVTGKSNRVYVVGDDSSMNVGYNSTDTESDDEWFGV